MGTTLLLADHLYDGSLEPPQKGFGVVVEQGRIADVGPEHTLGAHHDATFRIKGTLLPGLIDCHTHLVLGASADPGRVVKEESRSRTTARAIRHLVEHLLAGVTTIRDLGGYQGIDLELARAQHDGFVLGPRVLAAGNVIAMTGGHACFLGCEADGVDEVMKAVRHNLKHGAHVIKLIATGGVITPGVEPGSPQLSEAELRAAVLEAVHAGRKATAHAQGTEGIMNALRAGVHSIEHGFHLDEECVQWMVKRGVFLVATFAAAQSMMENLSALPLFIREKIQRVGTAHDRSFRMALAAGVPVATGTDAGTPFNPHGNIAREIELCIEHGATPLQALHAATGAAARLLGREELGVLRKGAVADLLSVDGDPTVEPAALRRVSRVWQSGREVDLTALRHVKERVAVERR